MKKLARQVRDDFALTTPRVTLSDMSRIYRAYGVTIDFWPHRFQSVWGAYFDDCLGQSVLIARWLPAAPRIFTLGHELKHHLVDRGSGLSYCSSGNEMEAIEIGAGVFAAELIFPDEDFLALLKQMGVGVGTCTPETLIRLRHESQTTLSYAGLAKKAEIFKLAPPKTVTTIKDWTRREVALYGYPTHKQLIP